MITQQTEYKRHKQTQLSSIKQNVRDLHTHTKINDATLLTLLYVLENNFSLKFYVLT